MYNNIQKADEQRNLRSPDEFYKTLIKPIRDSYVLSLIESASADEFSPYDKALNWQERVEPIKELKDEFIKFSSQWFYNLNKFNHVYITNGNSDSLVELFRRTEHLSFIAKDYSFYSHWFSATKKSHKALENPENVDEIVVSWPGYSNGDNTELNFARQCNPKKIHLDCAYLGLTQPLDNPLDALEFETISISFSKTLALPYNRIGLLFSKKPIPELAILDKVFYVNLAGVKLATKLLKNLSANYWWDTYGNKLDTICNRYNLKKTNSIMFAYDRYNRRVSLAPYWNAESFYCQYIKIEGYDKIKQEIAEFYLNNPIPDSYFKIINCWKVMDAVPTFKQWCIDNKLKPFKVAYISTPPNTAQSPHMDDGEEILAINFPVDNCETVETKMWDEENLKSIKLMTIGTGIPYYRYLVNNHDPVSKYTLDNPVMLNIKKVHSVVNDTDKPRISLSFRFERDPWEKVTTRINK
jgi:hypothetical protein